MENLQVSVIVLTYHPDRNKLVRTLLSSAKQKGISFEIVVADDGSSNEDWSWLEPFLQENGVTEYTVLLHDQNQGTVRNLLDAVKTARGKYVYAISPGDYFFDDQVLADLHEFSEKTQARMCFGNAVYYSNQDGFVKVTKQYGKPMCPQNYSLQATEQQRKIAFFGLDWINGATFFRERITAQEYLEKASRYCCYLEDNSSAAFALADGVKLLHCNRNVVWYEDGTGISTATSSKWKKILSDEAEAFAQALHREHPMDHYVSLMTIMLEESNRVVRIAKRLWSFPATTIKTVIQRRKSKPQQITCSEEDLIRLDRLLGEDKLCR